MASSSSSSSSSPSISIPRRPPKRVVVFYGNDSRIVSMCELHDKFYELIAEQRSWPMLEDGSCDTLELVVTGSKKFTTALFKQLLSELNYWGCIYMRHQWPDWSHRTPLPPHQSLPASMHCPFSSVKERFICAAFDGLMITVPQLPECYKIGDELDVAQMNRNQRQFVLDLQPSTVVILSPRERRDVTVMFHEQLRKSSIAVEYLFSDGHKHDPLLHGLIHTRKSIMDQSDAWYQQQEKKGRVKKPKTGPPRKVIENPYEVFEYN